MQIKRSQKRGNMKENEPGETTAGAGAPSPDVLLAHNFSPARATSEPRVHPSQKPYSINELAILHGLSRKTVIRIYESEPGRLVHQSSPDRRRKTGRRYRTITVPEHV